MTTNTRRYMTLFAEAADELMPAPDVQDTEEDVFDVLMRQVRSSRAPAAQPVCGGYLLTIWLSSDCRETNKKPITSRAARSGPMLLRSFLLPSAGATAYTSGRTANQMS